MNTFDPNNSLTGNEFLDFLSWCEVQGIDFENNNKEKENQNENKDDYNEDEYKYLRKERKR